MRRCLALALTPLALAVGPACVPGRAPGSSVELPIRKVVLYQNGVGYLERRGQLPGDELHLQVRPDQINDILTSLTVIDLEGGLATSVSLPIEKEAAQRLDQLPDQVRRHGGVLTLLQAFRGATVTVRGRDLTERSRTWVGRVVGVEGGAPGGFLTLLDEAGVLHNMPLAGIDSVAMQDRALEIGLRKALASSLEEGSWKPVDLTIRLHGAEEHDLLVSYVVAMPMWKPAYRLVVGSGNEKPLLQGWAVIDNLTGEDWGDVSLSLTSGSPISFIYDLHKPHFVARRQVAVLHGGGNVPIARAGVAAAPAPPAVMASGAPAGRASRARSRRPSMKKSKAAYRAEMDDMAMELEEAAPEPSMADVDLSRMAEGMAASARGEAVSGLFRYDIGAPVTVPDRSSTLVSLVNRRIDGEDVLLFRPEEGGQASTHPYRAIRFKNDTGFVLQGGPVTIYAGGAFVGEGLFTRIEAEAETFLPYSLETSVAISRHDRHKDRPVKLLRIMDGTIVCEVRKLHTVEYEVLQKGQESVRLYIRFPKRGGWTLQDPPKDLRELAGSRYLPFSVKPGKSKFEVREATPVERRVTLDSQLGAKVVALYLSDPDADQEVAKRLKEVMTIREQLSEVQHRLNDLRGRRRELSSQEDRVRRNIESLGKGKTNADLRLTLSKKLAAYEKDIDKLNGEIVTLDERRSELEARVRVLFRQITLKR